MGEEEVVVRQGTGDGDTNGELKRQVHGMCVCLVWLDEVLQWSVEW